ncbi:FAD-binding oxidoreductase [Porticoccus sp.]
MVAVSSWGRLSSADHAVTELANRLQVSSTIQIEKPGIAYGMGRSYGDACLNPGGVLWATRGLDRFIELDEISGRLVCEAGVMLRDIQRLVVPRGWMLPVTPGTQYVTVGGAIANDVHGKNHHVFGSFADHVQRITLLRTDSDIIKCGPDLREGWFGATVGGIGLTGLILAADIQLRRVSGPWLNTEMVPYANMDEFFELADSSEVDWEHTVSWVDCISGGGGRGIFIRGNHTNASNGPEPPRLTKTMPFVPPISMVNRFTLRAFNAGYYRLGKRKAGKSIAHYEPFFYPLDNIHQWNRIYGPKGFFQYQCVIPRAEGRDAIQEMLKVIAQANSGSFLAILKTFGNRESIGMLGFPRPGVTLALDFPNKGQQTEKLFNRLDRIVSEAGGCLYLAKDTRMSKELFEGSYPKLQDFLPYRDPGISSAMSRRLMGS